MVIIMPNYLSKFFFFCLTTSVPTFSIESLEWTQIADYPIDQDENGPYFSFAPIIEHKSSFYVFGGSSWRDEIYRYDRSWQFLGRMTKPRQG